MKLAVANLALFLFGVFIPCLKITPHLGDGGAFDFVGHIAFGENFQVKELSIFQGIIEFIKGGDYFLAIVLCAFTLFFPAYKMYLTMAYHYSKNSPKETYEKILKISKYSMLDIFVIGLIVLAFKNIPGGTTASIGLGAIFFASNIFLTKYILHKISREISSSQ